MIYRQYSQYAVTQIHVIKTQCKGVVYSHSHTHSATDFLEPDGESERNRI